MDTMHPFWTTPAVMEAAAAGRYGWLARVVRHARGRTLVEVAPQCHLSPSALSRIETGKRRLVDVHHLRRLSNALGIPAHLFGLAPSPTGAADRHEDGMAVSVGTLPTGSEDGDEAMRRRELLAGLAGITFAGLLPDVAHAEDTAPVTGQLDALLLAPAKLPATPMAVKDLRGVLTTGRAAFDACRYHELAEGLPGLIATALTSRDAAPVGQNRDQVSALLAHSYLLASELAVKRHEDGIAWVLADRALTAAKNSGDAATIAASSRSAAIAMRRQGHHNGAIDLLTDAALDLDADRGDPPAPLLSAFGSLLCTASYSAAQHGKSAQAVQLIEEAEQTAQRLGETIPSVGIARFSSTNVAIYRIGVHTALGESGTALSYARSIDLGQLPTAERRARCLIDTAKACERHGDISRASQALGLAERCAPEEIQRPSVRTLISGMLYAPGPTPTDLRPLAIRAGAAR